MRQETNAGKIIYIIFQNSDMTETGIVPSYYWNNNKLIKLDSNGKEMIIIHQFRAGCWEEAKIEYEKFLKG